MRDGKGLKYVGTCGCGYQTAIMGSRANVVKELSCHNCERKYKIATNILIVGEKPREFESGVRIRVNLNDHTLIILKASQTFLDLFPRDVRGNFLVKPFVVSIREGEVKG